MKSSAPEFRIGISGWRYPPWRGVFYPKDLTQARELEYISRCLNSIEINGSFYSLQHPSSYQHWALATPDDFVFSVKGPRFITHVKRLKNARPPLANFFGSGVLHLGKKLGPILWQLPEAFLFRPETLEEFFEDLPRTVRQAAKLSEEADRVTPSIPNSALKSRGRLRYALEVRHTSFENPEFIDLLRKHDVALVFADSAGRWPYMEDLTSDFVYARLHGHSELYSSGYDEVTLQWLSKRFKTWRAGKEPRDAYSIATRWVRLTSKRDVFVYFDNDAKVYAPFNAEQLSGMLNPEH